MAKDMSNSTWIASYSSDGTNVTIPVASLEGLTEADAHTSTGDIRALALAFLKTLYDHQQDLETADKPAGMAITGSRTIVTGEDQIRRSFSSVFLKDITGTELVSEA